VGGATFEPIGWQHSWTKIEPPDIYIYIYIYDFVVTSSLLLSANKGLQSNELEMEGRRRSSCKHLLAHYR
jgi:hypothetical protein